MTALAISGEDREQLLRWLADAGTSQRLRTRAGIVLGLADGLSDREVARLQGVARQTVALWRRRVALAGAVDTITKDAPGRGRKPSVSQATRVAVCKAYRRSALEGRPRSVRDLAREFALSAATVHRTLKACRGGEQKGLVPLAAPDAFVLPALLAPAQPGDRPSTPAA